MPDPEPLPRRMRVAAAVAVPWVAAFLGGATERWSQGVVLLLAGCCLLFLPAPRIRRELWIGSLVIAALAACAWLPASWFHAAQWRTVLHGQLGVVLPESLTPEPWVSLRGSLPLLGGLAWACWVVSLEWSRREIQLVARWHCAGIGLLALVALALAGGAAQIPFWKNDAGFGPFPNRNQTGDLFAVAAIVAAACVFDEARRGRRKWAGICAACAVLLAGAVFRSYSRASVLVLFAGFAAWLGGVVALRRSARTAALAAASLLGAGGAFLFFGGAVVERFAGRNDAGVAFRGLIYHDTLSMIRDAPWCGAGVGMFQVLFPFYRHASAAQNRVLHPEGDWLWLASELGWPAVVAAAVVLLVVLRRFWPLQKKSARHVRLGVTCAACAFVLHGCVDVSGHRLGTVLPALLVLSLVAAPRNGAAAAGMRWLQRAAGLLVVCAAGASWFFPDVKQAAFAAKAAGDLPRAAALAAQTLKIEPLDWQLYFLRGEVRAESGGFMAALLDFRRARALEPQFALAPFEEGKIWARYQPALAVEAWSAAIRRAGAEAPAMFSQMLVAVESDAKMTKRLWLLAGADDELRLIFLERTSGSEPARLAEFSINAARLTPSQQRRLKWVQARAAAAGGDARRACELAFEVIGKPSLPSPESRPLAEAEKAYLRSPHEPAAALGLYQARIAAAHGDDALALLKELLREPWCPKYVHCLIAEQQARRGEWQAAWESLQSAR